MQKNARHDNGCAVTAAADFAPATDADHSGTLLRNRSAGERIARNLPSARPGGQTHGAGSGHSGSGNTSSPEPGVWFPASEKIDRMDGNRCRSVTGTGNGFTPIPVAMRTGRWSV